MAEILTTTAAQQADAGATVFRVSLLVLDLFERRIKIHLRDWNGTAYGAKVISIGYEGQTAYDLIVALNKANLSTQSLQKRILNQLAADGKLPAGTQSGTVD